MAGIIKANGLQSIQGGVRPVAFNLMDMNDNATAVLENVQARAEAIFEQARRDAELIHRQAQEQGRAAAIKAAKETLHEELSRQLQTLMPALNDAIQSIHRAKQAWLKEWEHSVVNLAVRIAERVIRRQIEEPPSVASTLIRETLQLASAHRQLRLHLNPEDFETLGDQIETLVAQFSNLAPTDVVADPSVTRGGCVLNSEFGQIDQQIETQLARIEQELTA
ncbi:MAG: hypothetical protein IH991_14705 [Planctomycetes bacterium]|nr:hypothetical protein [Planctomycetota bacterium]